MFKYRLKVLNGRKEVMEALKEIWGNCKEWLTDKEINDFSKKTQIYLNVLMNVSLLQRAIYSMPLKA